MADKTPAQTGLNRREFISKSSAVTAAVSAAAIAGPALNVLGANDIIRMGVIGPGKRGRYLMDQMHRMSAQTGKQVEFIAVADIFEGWRMEGVKQAMRVAEECADYDHHKKLLENKDVDAVIIATPEHQHAYQLIDAVQAGKDVYCEKPMVQNIAQGHKVLKAVKSTDRVIQVGTQRRSVPLFYQANEMVKKGEIGQVTYCEGWWHRNARDGQPGPWAYEIPKNASEENINWNEFFYDAPKKPFSLDRYFRWRSYWDYSNGIGSDLMVHQIDAICMVMGVGIPKSVIASGGLYRWNDGRETPDTWSCAMEFEEGFQINYNARFSNITRPGQKDPIAARLAMMEDGPEKKKLEEALATLAEGKQFEEQIHDYGIRVCGSKGQIEVFCHWEMNVWPEPAWMWGDDSKLKYSRQQFGESQPDANDLAVRVHLENFVDCIKSRKKPNCTVEEGFNGAVISNMATLSYLNGKKVLWDKEKQEAKLV